LSFIYSYFIYLRYQIPLKTRLLVFTVNPWSKPLVNAFCSSLGSTLLFIKSTTIHPYTCGSSRVHRHSKLPFELHFLNRLPQSITTVAPPMGYRPSKTINSKLLSLIFPWCASMYSLTNLFFIVHHFQVVLMLLFVARERCCLWWSS
jgi:hypothetical protein